MSAIDLVMKPAIPFSQSARSISRSAVVGLSVALALADVIALISGYFIGSSITPIAGTPREIAGSLFAFITVFAVLAFHNQAYDMRCLTDIMCSCRSAALALLSSVFICFLVVFALKETSTLSRLAVSVGLFSAGWIMLLQRLFIARKITRNLSGRLLAELMIVDGCPLPENAAGMTLIDAQDIGLR
ncbi:MAG: sugar transferase, partial [Sphingobium sp.]